GSDDLGSRSGSRLGIEATVHQMYPFLHTYKSQATIPLNPFEVETCTRIFYHQLDIIRGAAHFNRELSDPAVLYCVVQRLLSDAEKAKRDVFGQVCRHAFLLELDAHFVLSRDLIAQALDRHRGSHVIELRRVEFVRQGLKVTRNLGTMLPTLLQ